MRLAELVEERLWSIVFNTLRAETYCCYCKHLTKNKSRGSHVPHCTISSPATCPAVQAQINEVEALFLVIKNRKPWVKD